MIEREFQLPNPVGIDRLAWRSYSVGVERAGGLRVTQFRSEREAKADFERQVAEAMVRGCVETERSLSRRVFRHPPAGKVWVIQLDGRSHVVQFGRDPCGMFAQPGDGWGQKKHKEFPTAEAARAAYHKLIDKKRREGYKEVVARKTAYTSPPAAAKPAARAARASSAPAATKARRT